MLASAQDVSGGGLAVALAECAMWGAGDRALPPGENRSATGTESRLAHLAIWLFANTTMRFRMNACAEGALRL